MMTWVPRVFGIAPRTMNITTPQANKKSIHPRPIAFTLNGMEGFDNWIGNGFRSSVGDTAKQLK